MRGNSLALEAAFLQELVWWRFREIGFGCQVSGFRGEFLAVVAASAGAVAAAEKEGGEAGPESEPLA
jgi:hypothetical protein